MVLVIVQQSAVITRPVFGDKQILNAEFLEIFLLLKMSIFGINTNCTSWTVHSDIFYIKPQFFLHYKTEIYIKKQDFSATQKAKSATAVALFHHKNMV